MYQNPGKVKILVSEHQGDIAFHCVYALCHEIAVPVMVEPDTFVGPGFGVKPYPVLFAAGLQDGDVKFFANMENVVPHIADVFSVRICVKHDVSESGESENDSTVLELVSA